MKIKRYFANDMRQAIRMVREEQGPDAVILSNRRIDGGVEIVAAVDYDESLVQRMAEEQAPAPVQKGPAQESPAVTKPEPVTAAPTMAAAVELPSRDARTPAAEPAPHKPEIVWSQDPSLVAMREEIQTLRGMLESQLKGLAWGEMKRSQPHRAKILERLTQLGLSNALSAQIADRLDYKGDILSSWRQALAFDLAS